MKITYRKINESFAARIWEIERTFPEWFKACNAVWTPDYDSYLAFFRNCSEVYGMFSGEELAAVVYLEIEGERVNIHVSVISETDRKFIIAFFCSLLKKKGAEGVRDYRAWIFEKNRGLKKIAEEVGFIKTGLKLYKGVSKNSPIRWFEFIRRQ